jgi:hypothetical protein
MSLPLNVGMRPTCRRSAKGGGISAYTSVALEDVSSRLVLLLIIQSCGQSFNLACNHPVSFRPATSDSNPQRPERQMPETPKYQEYTHLVSQPASRNLLHLRVLPLQFTLSESADLSSMPCPTPFVISGRGMDHMGKKAKSQLLSRGHAGALQVGERGRASVLRPSPQTPCSPVLHM